MPKLSDKRIFTEQLANVSQLAIARLARYSSSSENEVKQIFLFAAKRFCGIRFEQGPFNARWQFGDASIQFNRGSQMIGEIPLAEQSRRAA